LLRHLLGPVPQLDEVSKVWIFAGVGALGSAVLSWVVALLAYAALGLPSPASQWRLWMMVAIHADRVYGLRWFPDDEEVENTFWAGAAVATAQPPEPMHRAPSP
jgi:hypothetical protein